MKKILTALLILFTSSSCFAIVDTSKISIQEAVEIANKNNLDMQVSRLDIDVDKHKIKEANRLQNPAIGTTQNFGKAGRGEAGGRERRGRACAEAAG